MTSTEHILITGDFNLHVDVPSDSDALKFLDLLQCFGMKHFVNAPTYEAGHTLDLIIACSDESLLVDSPVVSHFISDHAFSYFTMNFTKPSHQYKTISYKSLKTIDTDKFNNDILSSPLSQLNSISETPDGLDQLVGTYNTTLASIIDRHAPVKTRQIAVRPTVPWMTSEI